MIMISRKFGGIKLGQGGVARAFRKSGRGVIKTYMEFILTNYFYRYKTDKEV